MSSIMPQRSNQLARKKQQLIATGLLMLAGCCTPASVDRTVIQPLPDKGEPRPYRELALRLRGQATVAMDAFYTNDWDAIQTAAKAINQTANLLPKATEIPEMYRVKVASIGPAIEKESMVLLAAARNREVQNTLDSVQKIHLEIRQLNMMPNMTP